MIFSNQFLAIHPKYKSEISDGVEFAFVRNDKLAGDTQVIGVYGMILKGTGCTEAECAEYGVCDLEHLTAALNKAKDNPNIGTLVLDFDTCGGTTTGLYEVGKLIEAIGNQKTVIGFTADNCFSAGYWLFAKCNEGYCSATSKLGSIGVTFERTDYTEAQKQNGIKVSHVSSSPRKEWFDSTTAMSPDEEAWIRSQVITLNEIFRSEVLSNRDIAPENLDAVVVNGFEAVATGFTDGIYNTLDDLLADLMKTPYQTF